MATDTTERPAIRARVLPPEEWAERLAGTPLGLSADRLDVNHSIIVVVEDEQDRVIAHWAAITVVHIEGAWEDPAHRGTGGVTRALLAEMITQLLAYGVREALTNIETPEVEAIVQKLGGRRIPGATWVLPLSEGGG